jgi:hypothetical protein
MSTLLVPDYLWEAIEPLLPKEPSKPHGGVQKFTALLHQLPLWC